MEARGDERQNANLYCKRGRKIPYLQDSSFVSLSLWRRLFWGTGECGKVSFFICYSVKNVWHLFFKRNKDQKMERDIGEGWSKMWCTIHTHLSIIPIPIISTTLLLTINWSDKENDEVHTYIFLVIVHVYKINEKAEEGRDGIWEYILHKKNRMLKYFFSNSWKSAAKRSMQFF